MCPWRPLRTSVIRYDPSWQTGRTAQKTKTAPSQKGTKAVASNSVVPPKLQRIKLSPAAFGALTLRCVRLLFAGSSGAARSMPCRNVLQPADVLSGRRYAHSDPIIAICHNSHAAKQAQCPLAYSLNYSIRRIFVNGFWQNLRHPDAVCTGYLAVLDGHGRVSRIPPISIFFAAHCITNRPISLYDHRVGFKVRCAVR